MKLWIDADACPGKIKEIIIRAAYKRKIDTIFVSNKIIELPETSFISFVKVEQGPDVADAYIAERTTQGELVITQDIPLASLVIDKGATAISFHGELFTTDNIKERLSYRNFMQELRDSGIQTAGPKPFSEQHKQRFANAFDKQIVKLFNK